MTITNTGTEKQNSDMEETSVRIYIYVQSAVQHLWAGVSSLIYTSFSYRARQGSRDLGSLRKGDNILQVAERQGIADPGRARKEHDEPIDTTAPSTGGRKAMLQGLDIALVDNSRYFLVGFRIDALGLDLKFEFTALLEGIILLFVHVGHLATLDEELGTCGYELACLGTCEGFG